MVPLPVTPGRLTFHVVAWLFLSGVPAVSAQEEPQAKQQLEIMQAALGSLELESSDVKSKSALTFASQPLFRYSDPTRGTNKAGANVLLDAGVWRLGTEGRPT